MAAIPLEDDMRVVPMAGRLAILYKRNSAPDIKKDSNGMKFMNPPIRLLGSPRGIIRQLGTMQLCLA